MKTLVAYYTQTGNTQKIAQAIYAELTYLGHDVAIKNVRRLKAEALAGYDVLFLGSPCHSSDLAKPVKKLLDKMEAAAGMKLAGFVTHSAYTPEGSEQHRQHYERWAGRCDDSFEAACKAKGLHWIGYFSCQGAPSKLIEIFIRRAVIKDANEWPGYIAETRKHPNTDDEAKARAFAREAAGRCEAVRSS